MRCCADDNRSPQMFPPTNQWQPCGQLHAESHHKRFTCTLVVCLCNIHATRCDAADFDAAAPAAAEKDRRKIWIVARQHPGESMAEWFIQVRLLSPLIRSFAWPYESGHPGESMAEWFVQVVSSIPTVVHLCRLRENRLKQTALLALP